jgi:hypothetical protein
MTHGYRIWYTPSGEVTIFTHLRSEPEKQAASNAKMAARLPAGSTFEDVATLAELQVMLPPDRSERFRWRKSPTGRGIAVDRTVPLPPDTRQARVARIDGAATLDEVKAILKEIV